MFPGTTTKISEAYVTAAATIDAKTDLIRTVGRTDIATIRPNYGGGFSGVLFIVPTDGTVNLLTTGNIALAATIPQYQVAVLVYSKTTEKWYPGAIS